MKTDSKIAIALEAIRARIRTGSLAHGERLPSIRRFASQIAMSPSTVNEAYERLVAEGIIVARPGSGYYVSSASIAQPGRRGREDHALDPFWVSRQALEADSGMVQPGCGWLPEAWMPQALLRMAMRDVARADDALLTGYGPAMGSPGLRHLLSRRFAEEHFLAPIDHILLTNSGTQAMDMVCRLLLKPGDCVLIDDPCYFNFRALLAVHRVRVVGVPFGADGPDLAVFARVVQEEKPVLYLTNSGLQNPTGGSITLRAAHRLLVVASQHGVQIVEDDIFADFAPRETPSLAPLDGLNHVIRIGSFSKTLSASLRCGYIAARPDLIRALGDLQIATGFAGASPVAAAIAEYVLKGGGYRRHLETLNRKLARLRRDCAERLASMGIEVTIRPKGGFSLWGQMPDGCDVSRLARLALDKNLVLAPGAVFGDSPATAQFMRFNVAQMTDPSLSERLKGLIDSASL
ncbi:aminotransferase-like domain-containing protein [Asaia krungthepensis]|uniref:Transcriptional regulator n=1 Tax=Asaia krungthepensis NRIC 0535 TaxID=1307925 RepID=A0ABQ0PXV8_9PROT|nr:PLP-dependent aminotransferase family protein [Asaia krungthepensis]GBQ84273.1 transcriptional regulator [Asaia krungthepensis NRIC 0535]